MECLNDTKLTLPGGPVMQLSSLKASLEEDQSPIMRRIFSFLFPFGPGWNSGKLSIDSDEEVLTNSVTVVLGTFYISS